jgi:predicted nucleic acid-binding protein
VNIVVDTNILFSALLREKNRFAELLFLESSNQYFLPRFAIVEIFKHKEKILRHAKCPEEVLLEILHRLLRRFQFLDENLISTASYIEAWRLCKDVDEKDLVFVAMSIEFDAQFWTTDQKLMDALTAKGFDKFYNPF